MHSPIDRDRPLILNAQMQKLGPKAFQGPISNMMLENSRSYIVSESSPFFYWHDAHKPIKTTSFLAQRKRCFLEQLDWQTVPWQGSVPQRSYLSLVTDIFCDIPGLMEDVTLLRSNSSQGINGVLTRVSLKDKLICRVKRLEDLMQRWDSDNPFSCWELPPQPNCSVVLDDGKHPFQTILHYMNAERAIEVINFNAVSILLYSLCDEVGLSEEQVSVAAKAPDHGPYANPILRPSHGSMYSHAIEICRSMDYMAGITIGSHSALEAMVPLSVAYPHVANLPNLKFWLQRVLRHISELRGFLIAPYAPQMLSQARGKVITSALA